MHGAACWLDKAQSWLSDPCSFPTARGLQNHANSLQAALMGGTTMVMALVLPEQHCSLLDAYENCRALTDANAVLHEVRSEMETLVREHGVNSFQMFMAYKDTMMLRDSELYQTLQTCKDIGAVARVHAENGELVAEGAKEALDLGISGPEGIEISRPEELESEATHRAVTIPNKAHEVAWRVGVEAERRDDNVGGSMNPVLTVILLPVQHGVSHRGLCVDHLTCRDKQKTSVTRRQSASRRCHCQNLSEFKPLNRAPELPFLSISSFKSNFQTHISYP
uniref:Uncharacterized protein n=1 Tax=Gasterosteus aculeatus aculeatus TaxID=481459 RepID=A0AAQ4QAN7_GASAC